MFPALKPTAIVLVTLVAATLLPIFVQHQFAAPHMGGPVHLMEFAPRQRLYPIQDMESLVKKSVRHIKRMNILSPRRISEIEFYTGSPLSLMDRSVRFHLVFARPSRRGEKETFLGIVGETTFVYRGNRIPISAWVSPNEKVVQVATRERVVLMEGDFRNLTEVDEFLSGYSQIPLEEMSNTIPPRNWEQGMFFPQLRSQVNLLSLRLGAAYKQYLEDKREAQYVEKLIRRDSPQISNQHRKYIQHCARCHGYTGTAVGPGVMDYDDAMISLRHGRYFDRLSRDELAEKILGNSLHDFDPPLKLNELNSIISYIRKISRQNRQH